MKISLFYILFLPLLVLNCGSFQKATTLNEETGYFPAKENKEVSVIKEIQVDRDTLKTLLVVPESEYSLAMGKNLNYFNEVIHFSELETRIIQAGLLDSVPSLTDRIGLYKAAIHYKPYVILDITKQKKENGWFAGLKLYDPRRAKVIFQNQIHLNLMWDGWTDQGTMFPLYNSLLDYLRIQK